MRKDNILKRNTNLKKLNEKVREQKAITLIALVITIIVLLILASVSIAMLTGENGILTKATTAKESAQRAEVIERAQIDIVSAQTENESEDITKAQLKAILDKYFIETPEMIPDDLSTVTLTTKSEYGNYSIKVSEIYSGTLSSGGITWAWTDSDTSGTKNIGDVVNCSTGESFRIISIEGENYALLAEKNIGVDLKNSPDTYLKQNDSAGTVAFCSNDTYSSLGNDLTSVESLNDNETIIADTTSAVYYARKYAESITGNAEDGRLMKVGEVRNITGLSSSGEISSPNWIKTTNYWLDSAHSANRVWIVDDGNSYLNSYGFYHGGRYGVRPVIEISKSSIQ